MKKIYFKNTKDTHFILLCTLSLFPILPRGIESALMILLAVISIYTYFITNNKKIKWTYLFILSSVFFIFLFSSILSENISSSIKYIIKTLPILIFPFSFLITRNFHFGDTKKRIILNFYLVGVCLMLVHLDLSFFESLYMENISRYDLRLLIQNSIDIHGTYLSMWIGLGVLITINQIKNYYKNNLLLITYILLIIYCFHWLVFIEARMPLLATIISSLVYITLILKISKKKILLLGISISFILGLLLSDKIILTINSFKNYESSIPKGKYADNWSSISNEDVRSGIYYCCIEIISQNKALGVGIGDVDDLLQECYDNEYYYTDVYKILNYNSHSQYLLIILGSGLLGFLIFIISFFFIIKIDIQKHQYLHLCFLILTLICFCFENILSRHDGVIFFGLFNSVLFFMDHNINKTNINIIKLSTE